MVSQNDVEMMLRLENTLGQKLELYPTDDEELSLLKERVDEARRQAASQLRDEQVKSSNRKRSMAMINGSPGRATQECQRKLRA